MMKPSAGMKSPVMTVPDSSRSRTSSVALGHFTEVGVSMEATLLSVDDAEDIFDATVLVHCVYRDPSYLIPVQQARDLFEVDESYEGFVPHLSLTNCLNPAELTFETETRINKHRGLIITSFIATSKLRETLELKKFPFDQQVFRIGLTSNNSKLFPWTEDKTILSYKEMRKIEMNEKDDEARPKPTFVANSASQEWLLRKMKVTFSPKRGKSALNLNIPKFEMTLMCTRSPKHYFNNFFLIIFFIAGANILVTAIPVGEVSDRLAYAVTILLTLVAYKFVLMQDSPKIGYKTYMDHYVQRAFFVCTITMLEIALSGGHIAAQAENEEETGLAELFPFGSNFLEERFGIRNGIDFIELLDILHHCGVAFIWSGINLWVTINSTWLWTYERSWKKIMNEQSENFSTNTRGTSVAYRIGSSGEKPMYAEPDAENDINKYV